MNYNKIEYGKKDGWGDIYHGDHLDNDAYRIPGPLFIVTADHDEQCLCDNWIDHKSIFGNFSPVIADDDNGCYRDDVLLGVICTVAAMVTSGINVYIHCWAGVSRSSYVDCGVLMKLLNISFDDALALVRRSHPQANPRSVFCDHLRRMESRIRQ